MPSHSRAAGRHSRGGNRTRDVLKIRDDVWRRRALSSSLLRRLISFSQGCLYILPFVFANECVLDTRGFVPHQSSHHAQAGGSLERRLVHGTSFIHIQSYEKMISSSSTSLKSEAKSDGQSVARPPCEKISWIRYRYMTKVCTPPLHRFILSPVLLPAPSLRSSSFCIFFFGGEDS